MVLGILKKVVGDYNERELKKLWPIAAELKELEAEVSALGDAELRAKTDEFRKRLAQGETLEDILPEAFAVVREASRRRLGMRHFDVQILGGVVLHQGKIAEMKTGEGKTLAATLPVYLNALDKGRAPDHRERLPGQARHPVDGPHLSFPGPFGGRPPARRRLFLQPRG